MLHMYSIFYGFYLFSFAAIYLLYILHFNVKLFTGWIKEVTCFFIIFFLQFYFVSILTLRRARCKSQTVMSAVTYRCISYFDIVCLLKVTFFPVLGFRSLTLGPVTFYFHILYFIIWIRRKKLIIYFSIGENIKYVSMRYRTPDEMLSKKFLSAFNNFMPYTPRKMKDGKSFLI